MGFFSIILLDLECTLSLYSASERPAMDLCIVKNMETRWKMKVLLINGSPRKNGNTSLALATLISPLDNCMAP